MLSIIYMFHYRNEKKNNLFYNEIFKEIKKY